MESLGQTLRRAREERPPPAEFHVWWNDARLPDLKARASTGRSGPPSLAVAPEVTEVAFQCWMCIELYPDEELGSGYDLSFRLWLMLVKESGRLCAGYIEPDA